MFLLTVKDQELVLTALPTGPGTQFATAQASLVDERRMDERVFRKLKTLSFFSVCLVLLSHSVFVFNGPHPERLTVNYHQHSLEVDAPLVQYLQIFVRSGLTRVNRALFFMTSACLFFWTLEPRASAFIEKFRRRLTSLVVPYVLFSVLSLLTALAMSRLPFFQSLIVHQVTDFPTLGRGLFLQPLFYQLWFLRDLILLMGLTPVVYLLVSRLGWWSVGLALVYWISEWPLPLPVLSQGAFCFFCIGACIGLKRPALDRFRLQFFWVFLVCWLAACGMHTTLFLRHHPAAPLLQKAGIVAGAAALWAGYDRLSEDWRRRIYRLVPFTFFIYLTHEPLLSFFKKLMFLVVPLAAWSSLATLVLLPLVILGICVQLARWLKVHHAGLFRVVTGGRG